MNSGSHASITGTVWKPSGPASQPFWKTATSTPYAAPTDSRFITIAFSGTTSERKTSSSSTKLNREHEGEHDRRVHVDEVEEVRLQRRLPADEDLGVHAGERGRYVPRADALHRSDRRVARGVTGHGDGEDQHGSVGARLGRRNRLDVGVGVECADQ